MIYELKRLFKVLCSIYLFSSSLLFAQELHSVPTFRLVGAGYGAAALGMGGAFVAVANDLSAVYWNPAGLSQLSGFQVSADYRFRGDSDEDFSAVVFPNRFESPQRYSLSGNQLEALAVSYSFGGEKAAIVPAFAWQRTSVIGPKRELKETAGVVEFPTPQSFFQSEGTFNQDFDGGDEEYNFAISAKASEHFLVGGAWTFLANGPEENLNGQFHDSFITRFQVRRTDFSLKQTLKQDPSGNYFKLGFLFTPQPSFSVGGTLRFAHTVKTDLTLQRTGTASGTVSFKDANGNITRVEGFSEPINDQATAKSEINLPAEWTGGAAVRIRDSVLLSGSLTYSNWKDAEEKITGSSDLNLIQESTLPFPTLRANTQAQPSLLQWRGGIEYMIGSLSDGAILLRSGIFRDRQPYGTADGDGVYFKGYTFGAGVHARFFRFDAAFIREKGDLTFTPEDRDSSHLSDRRWVMSITLAR